MSLLPRNTLLSEVDLRNRQVRKVIVEMLPQVAKSRCCSGVAPLDLVDEIASGVGAQTIEDLLLELAILLTNGRSVQQVEIDTSAVELVPAALDRELREDPHWARLVFDLSRPDWTVIVSLQALQEASETAPRTPGAIRILVRTGLDFRGWLSEERTREMLHQWYVQYQVAGSLHSERQLAELHEELSWVEERGRFVFASQLIPLEPADAIWRLQEIRGAGGARPWARQLWEHCDRPVILAADGSWEYEEVISELTTGAERLLALAAEREC